jgi:hypothetical protein
VRFWEQEGHKWKTLQLKGVVMMTVGVERFADGVACCDERGMVICCSQPRPGKAEGERAGDGL